MKTNGVNTRRRHAVTNMGLSSNKETAQVTNSNTVDWPVLQLDGVLDITHRAAFKVAAKFGAVIGYDDLHQEAAVIVASNPATVRGYIDREQLGLLHHWLWCDLTTIARREATKKNRQISYDTVRSLAA